MSMHTPADPRTVLLGPPFPAQQQAAPGDVHKNKGIALLMGQCGLHHCIPKPWHLVEDPDPFGAADLVIDRVSLEQAPEMYELLKNKEDGSMEVVLQP